MVETTRAQGANLLLRWKENTGDYGLIPTGNWRVLRAFTYGLSKSQNLVRDPLLGAGRDATQPARGAINVTGQVIFPVDFRNFYDPLVNFLGPVQGAPTQIGARGWIQFSVNPSNTETIIINGTTWTFVTAAPGAEETQIAGTLQLTLDQLVIDTNASVDANLTPATYSRIGNRLMVNHDTADASGDAFTLSAGTTVGAKVSKATLFGGGLWSRIFHSGRSDMTDAAAEVEMPDLSGGNKFRVHNGIRINSMAIERAEEGFAKATCELVGQDEADNAATSAGAPDELVATVFVQPQGQLLVDDVGVANVVGGGLTLRNNLDVVRTLRDDNLIEGADPGIFDLDYSLVARFSDNALKAAAEAAATVTSRYGFLDKGAGAEIEFNLHELHLPTPAVVFSGPGGSDVTYEMQGAKATAPARSMTVTLINDVNATGYNL